jgi:hypothetical protein
MEEGKYLDFGYLGLKGRVPKIGKTFKRVKPAWGKKFNFLLRMIYLG